MKGGAQTSRATTRLTLVGLGAALAACGGSAPAAKSPSEQSAAAYAPPPAAPAAPPPPARAPAEPKGPATPAPAPRRRRRVRPDRSPAGRGDTMAVAKARGDLELALRELDTHPGACASACRALASLDRAATHLCDNASSREETRMCDDAKRVVRAAHARVRSTCGVCP